MNLVSTIIPVHKYSEVVKESILSAIHQDFISHKVFVIVNSLEDDIVEKIHNDFGQQIQVSEITKLGVSFARNEGIKLSSSEYIAFLDSDDVWYKNKLSKQIEYMRDNKYLICGTLMDYRTKMNKSKITNGDKTNNPKNIQVAKYMPFPVSSLIISRSCLQDNNIFSENLGTKKYGQVEDLELVSRLSNQYEIGLYPISTGAYLINTKGITSEEFVKQRSAGHHLSKLRNEGNVDIINDFNYSIKRTNKIKHEHLRLKLLTNIIDKHYIKSLFYFLFLTLTNPYLTYKKLIQRI